MDKPFLSINNLWLAYNSIPIIKGISFKVYGGQIVAFIGRNGAGKSTIMRAITGLLKVQKGGILFQQKKVTNWQPVDLIKMGISFVPQGRACFPDITVEENLDVALSVFNLPKNEQILRKNKVFELFPRLHRETSTHVYKLSGGLQQMLVISMALIQNPKCILLDEPSLGLSQVALEELQNSLKQFANDGGCILIVEQKPKVVFAIGDYAYYLENGQINMQGKPMDLKQDQNFLSRYLNFSNDENLII